MTTDDAILPETRLLELVSGNGGLTEEAGGLSMEQYGVLSELRDGARMHYDWPSREGRETPPARSRYQRGGELLVVRAAESAMASGGEAAATLQPGHPFKTYIPSTGITDRSCVTSAHETLPWGSHYRNLAVAPGHAWVVFALEHDPQVREAATRAQAVAGLQDNDDSDDTDNKIPVLDAYSGGSVLAKGVESPAAALVRIFGTDVSATARLASVDVALSSGRSEWTGLVMVLCILREVRASVVLRLGNLQVVNIFNDGEWRFWRNWLRRGDRDMTMLAWALDRERRERGYGELTALRQL